uniref:SCO5717 family growth-regulating ATPase n=2 Tax=Streptomyces TaxID=1883 RepID=UPI002481CC38
MSSDRDGIRGGWATPGDDQPDAEAAVEATGEFTIDYAPPAWYTQNASGGSDGAGFPGASGAAVAASGPAVPAPATPAAPADSAAPPVPP